MDENIENLLDYGISVLLMLIALSVFLMQNGTIERLINSQNTNKAMFYNETSSSSEDQFFAGSEIMASIMNDNKGIQFIIENIMGTVMGTYTDYDDLTGLSIINPLGKYKITYVLDTTGNITAIKFRET